MRNCEICNEEITEKNNGMFLRQFLTEKEIDKIPVKNLCCGCKKDLMFANLIAIL
jgi:hypothetical protein